MEEPAATNPLFKLAKLATDKVLLADNGPETLNWAAIVEEAEEINPPIKEARLSICKVE